MWRALTLPAAMLISGCGILDLGIACEDILEYGVYLTVLERTGMPAVSDTVIIEAIDGTYRDTQRWLRSVPQPLQVPFGLAPERDGTYTLTVDARGYAHWEQSGVRVRDAGCHVAPVRVTAVLDRT